MIPLLLAALLANSGENRLWFVDVELRGSCAALRLDCGPDGETRVLGPLVAGESGRWSLPVPVRAPLGREQLELSPLPRIEVLPPGAAASARILGWSASQPSDRLRSLGGSSGHSRPAPAVRPARAEAVELVLVACAAVGLLLLRRRGLWLLVLGAGSAALTFQLARARRGSGGTERVLEWEAGAGLALAVQVGLGELVLPRDGLEVVPEGQRLEFQVEAAGHGRVRARGARLVGLEGAAVPLLSAARNELEVLVEVWTRASGGSFVARGRWELGEPLPAPVPGVSGAPPPGWLAGGFPPGRPLLLARSERGRWLRAQGFVADTPSGD